MHIKMGKGDIAIMLSSTRLDKKPDSISFVKREGQYPMAVDVDCDVTNKEISKGTLGHISFGHEKSIDALINQLKELKARY